MSKAVTRAEPTRHGLLGSLPGVIRRRLRRPDVDLFAVEEPIQVAVTGDPVAAQRGVDGEGSRTFRHAFHVHPTVAGHLSPTTAPVGAPIFPFSFLYLAYLGSGHGWSVNLSVQVADGQATVRSGSPPPPPEGRHPSDPVFAPALACGACSEWGRLAAVIPDGEGRWLVQSRPVAGRQEVAGARDLTRLALDGEVVGCRGRLFDGKTMPGAIILCRANQRRMRIRLEDPFPFVPRSTAIPAGLGFNDASDLAQRMGTNGYGAPILASLLTCASRRGGDLLLVRRWLGEASLTPPFDGDLMEMCDHRSPNTEATLHVFSERSEAYRFEMAQYLCRLVDGWVEPPAKGRAGQGAGSALGAPLGPSSPEDLRLLSDSALVERALH